MAEDTEVGSSEREIVSDRCQCSEVRRMMRRGIIERWIYPLMSLYPFLCGRCGRRFMVLLDDEEAGWLKSVGEFVSKLNLPRYRAS